MADEGTPITGGEAAVIADGIKEKIGDAVNKLEGITEVEKNNSQTAEELKALTEETKDFKETLENLLTSLDLKTSNLVKSAESSEKREADRAKRNKLKDQIENTKSKADPSVSDVANGNATMSGFLLLHKTLKQMFGLNQKDFDESSKERKEGKKSKTGGSSDGMMKTFSSTLNATMGKGISKMGDILGNTFKEVSGSLTSAFSQVKDVMSNTFAKLSETFGKVTGFFKNFGKFGENLKGIFSGKDGKNGDKKGKKGDASAAGVLILASNITDVNGYVKSYDNLVKQAGKLKGISLNALENTQTSLDKFTSFLSEKYNDKKAKEYEKYKKNIGTFAGVFDTILALGKTLIKIAILTPVFLTMVVTTKLLGFFVDHSAKFFEKASQIENVDDANKALAGITDVFSNVAKSAMWVALAVPFILPAIAGVLASTLYVKTLKIFIDSMTGKGKSFKKDSMKKAAESLDGVREIAVSVLLSTIMFTASIPFIIPATIALGMLLLWSLAVTVIVGRLSGAKMTERLQSALTNIKIIEALAMGFMIASALLALSTLFILPAILGILGMALLVGAIIVFSKLAGLAKKGIALTILVAISMVVLAGATLLAVMALSKTGKIIQDEIKGILFGLAAFAGLFILVVVLGLIADKVLAPIVVATIASLAIAIFAVSLYVTVSLLSKINAKQVLIATLNVVTSTLLFAAAAVAGIAATMATPVLAFLIASSILLMVAALPLAAAVFLLSNTIKLENITAASKAIFKSTLLFGAAAVTGTVAMAAAIPIAALTVASVLLLPAAGAIFLSTKALSSVDPGQVISASKVMGWAALLFGAAALAGAAAILALPGAIAMAPTALALGIATPSIKTAIENLSQLDGQVAPANTVMLGLAGFFGLAALAGAASMLALVGSLAMVPTALALNKAMLPLTEAIAALSALDVAPATGAVEELGGFFGSFALMSIKIGLAMPGALLLATVGPAFKNVNILSDTVASLSAIKNETILSAKENAKGLTDFLKEMSGVGKKASKLEKHLSTLVTVSNGMTEAFVSMKNAFNAYNEVEAIFPHVESVNSLKDSLDVFSKIKTKGIKGFGDDLASAFKKIDKTTDPIDRLSKSIRGLNEELQNLNKNGNAVKILRDLESGQGSSKVRDAKSSKENGNGARFDTSKLEQILTSVDEKLDTFFKLYEQTNNKSSASWKG